MVGGLAFPARALEPVRLPSQFLYRHWQDELPQQTVRTVAQTPDGYLWLGTQAGLVRFDGLRFKVYEPTNTPALGSSDIMRLFVDRQGRLWVATRGGGVAVLENGAFTTFQSNHGPAIPEMVLAVAETSDGALWFGTRAAGLLEYRNGQLRAYTTAEGLGSNNVYSLLVDAQGVLWAGCLAGGLARWEDGRFRAVSTDLLGTDSVTALAEDASGTLWIGTRRAGLLSWPADRAGAPTLVAPASGLTVMALAINSEGDVLAGTIDSGLLRFRDGKLDRFDKSSGLSADAVLALFVDREGSLWVGTEGGGLNQLHAGAFRAFGEPEGLGKSPARVVLQDRSGAIWVGTDGSGLARLDGETVQFLTTAEGLASDSISALYETRDGALWIGSRGRGLNRLRAGRIDTPAARGGITPETVLAMIEDSAGGLWLGTVEKGLLFYTGNGYEAVSHSTLSKARIWSLARTPSGELLVGTDGAGLWSFNPQTGAAQEIAAELSKASITALHVDADGAIWVGTYGQGLALLASGQLSRYTVVEGLSDNSVLQVLDDEGGFLWTCSNKGVQRLAKAELVARARGSNGRLQTVIFGKADGMRSVECNGSFQPAGWRDRSGQMWFSTLAGVVAVDPKNLPTNELPPAVVIEEVRVESQLLAVGDPVKLKPGSRRFEFQYTALSFVEPSRMRFRYRMEGYDEGWIEVGGAERRAVYTSLPTGRSYRFRVMAANNDGVWNEAGASFAFEVEPYFWQRPAFGVLAAALLVVLAWSLYKLRVRQLLHRTEQLQKLVAERTAEVVAQRDELEHANTELTRLNQFKSEFLGIAAHDLKNPLSVIYGYAGLMISKGDSDPALLRVARRISASANQMLTIVSDLLDTTAMESGKLRFERQPTDLTELVSNVVESQRVMAADRQIDLQLITDAPVACQIDREKITRVVQNLTSNAIRYSKPGTPVEVRVERVVTSAEPRVRVSVKDYGPGLTPDQVARIFERFERLAAKHQVVAASTGLGLSIVKQFVEIHGGRIWVESQPQQGSTFLVELPVEG